MIYQDENEDGLPFQKTFAKSASATTEGQKIDRGIQHNVNRKETGII